MVAGTYEWETSDIEPVRDRLLERALGRLVIEWPLVEHHVEMLIWRLFELLPIEGSQITSRQSIGTTCDLLLSAAKRLPASALRTRIEKTTTQIKDMLPARNDMVHGFWVRERKSRNVYVVSLRRAKGEKIEPRRVSTRFVLAHVHDAKLIGTNLRGVLERLEERRPARRAKAPEGR